MFFAVGFKAFARQSTAEKGKGDDTQTLGQTANVLFSRARSGTLQFQSPLTNLHVLASDSVKLLSPLEEVKSREKGQNSPNALDNIQRSLSVSQSIVHSCQALASVQSDFCCFK